MVAIEAILVVVEEVVSMVISAEDDMVAVVEAVGMVGV